MSRYRFDLEKAIAAWRRSLSFNRAFTADDLDELEAHLRDAVAAAVAAGEGEEAAFEGALREMGAVGAGEAEYRKVYWGKRRRRGELTRELAWGMTMFAAYFKIAVRNLLKQRGYTVINVVGLAVGLACSLLILLWVRDELQVDRFLPEVDRVHQVLRNMETNGQIYTWTGTPKPLADVLRADYPVIEHVVQMTWDERFVVTRDGEAFREAGFYADEAFFDVFPFAFLQGDPATALAGTDGVVLTDRLARRLFGNDWQAQGAALGQSITLDQRKAFTVTGVIEDLPPASSRRFDVVLPIQEFFARNAWAEQWGNNALTLYLKLRPDATPEALEAEIAGLVNQYEEGADEALFLQPYGERYLHSEFENGVVAGGRIEYVRIFSVVAVFLLVIAAINFMNLATARSARRAREIGVRKAVGAHRRSLIGQFLGEATLLASVAAVLALGGVAALLPTFNEVTDKATALGSLDASFFGLFFALTLAVGVLAGSYPALYLSSFDPLLVLRGVVGRRSGAVRLRKALVVFQFALSTLLIVATLAIYLQFRFIHERDVGLDREHVAYVTKEGALSERYDAFRQALLQQPGVAQVTAANADPLAVSRSTGGVTWDGKDPDAEHEVSILNVHHDFIETMRMELVEGRAFSAAFGAEELRFVINEQMAQLLGGGAVVGQRLNLWGDDGVVIGVVRDFDMNSVYDPDEPLVMRLALEAGATSRVLVRTRPGETEAALASLEAVYAQFNPDYPFDYGFLDEDFETRYRSEAVLGTLANAFAGVAIFISCLGLFGLISYTAEQRTKEIGVRKVLGATVPSVVRLLTADVTRLVVAGVVLGLPVAYLVVERWLAGFEERAAVGPELFLAAGALALLLAWLTVSVQAVRAARADPVRSLRYE